MAKILKKSHNVTFATDIYYALLLKIKCNYTDKKLKKEIKKGLKELKQIFKDFDRDSILFKYKKPRDYSLGF